MALAGLWGGTRGGCTTGLAGITVSTQLIYKVILGFFILGWYHKSWKLITLREECPKQWEWEPISVLQLGPPTWYCMTSTQLYQSKVLCRFKVRGSLTTPLDGRHATLTPAVCPLVTNYPQFSWLKSKQHSIVSYLWYQAKAGGLRSSLNQVQMWSSLGMVFQVQLLACWSSQLEELEDWHNSGGTHREKLHLRSRKVKMGGTKRALVVQGNFQI